MVWYNIREDRIVNNDHIMSDFETLNSGARYLTYTTAQRVALTQAIGLTVYDTDIKKLFVSDGYNWIEQG